MWFRECLSNDVRVLMGGIGLVVLTIFVFNQTIKQDAGHGNSAAWEVRVVIQPLTELNSSGSIDVSI
jgi:hypothetical protein